MAPDKILHLKAGAMAAGFGAGLGAGLAFFFVNLVMMRGPVAVIVLLMCAAAGAISAASAAGITKEKADEADNVIHPGMHGVETMDAVTTAIPGVVAALVLSGLAALVAHSVLPWAL